MTEHREYITPLEAVRIHRRSGFGNIGKFTVITWIKKYGFGLKIGGRWKVDKKKFERFLREGTHEEA